MKKVPIVAHLEGKTVQVGYATIDPSGAIYGVISKWLSDILELDKNLGSLVIDPDAEYEESYVDGFMATEPGSPFGRSSQL